MLGFARVVVPLAVALAVGGRAVAADLLVERGNPNAYQSLQAALDAAQPGDRILIKGGTGFDEPLQVRKSVTIESFDDTRQQIVLGFNQYRPGQLLVEELTAGIPLVLRRLSFVPFDGHYVFGPMIKTSSPVVGEIRIEDVDMTFPETLTHGMTLVDVSVARLWLRRCSLRAEDLYPLCGCGDCRVEASGSGSNCVRFDGDNLVIEDCSLRAASAASLYFDSGCDPERQWATASDGGFALVADCRSSVLIRSILSDGNGGSVGDGPWFWNVNPTPGRAGRSQLDGGAGELNAFDVGHEEGRDGVLGSQGPGRGANTLIGDPLAPLSVGGSGVLGDCVTVDVAPFQHSAAALLIGHGWGLVPTPFGNALLDFTLPVVAVPVSQPSISFRVPNDAALVHLPVISQLFYANDGWFFGNASGLEIRL